MISVALAVFNEEANLGDCLESVRRLADEIVIVDGGSTDKTIAIARKYKAKIIQTNNPPIFHLNKQKAIDACSGDWILQLDADERVTPDLKKEILDITALPASRDGYWLPRKNFFLGRYLTKGGQYPDYTLRLYRRGKGRLPCKSVHEQAVVAGSVGYLKQPLLHLADPTFSRYLGRFDRYTGLIADELGEAKVKLNFTHFVSYFFCKPVGWFLMSFLRHRGYVDGFPGFVFSFFSALRFPVAYIKYYERQNKKNGY